MKSRKRDRQGACMRKREREREEEERKEKSVAGTDDKIIVRKGLA